MGHGAPNKQGTNGVHGAPLGPDETAAARENLGWNHAPFEIPKEVYADFKEIQLIVVVRPMTLGLLW